VAVSGLKRKKLRITIVNLKMIDMKYLICLCVVCVTGCSTIKEAKSEFDREVNGFRVEFARVFLKKEIESE
jgi:hypothetical protein